jgi:hypothetical protein
MEMSAVGPWHASRGHGLLLISVVGVWYPNATKGWYVKGGSGAVDYRAHDGTNELLATAPAISFGTGYEFRLSRKMSVVPFLDAQLSPPVLLEYNGRPTGEKVQLGSVLLGLGLTWH